MLKEETIVSVDVLFWKIAMKDDEDAFRLLFVNFFPSLTIFARRYISDLDTCEDIVQDTFLKIWKNRKKLDIKTSTRNFLITTVKNSCLDYLRKKETEIRYQESSFNNNEQLYSQEDILSLADLEDTVNVALKKLPENIRLIFEKSRFEGKTYREIAEECEISVKTVEAYMTRALKTLRKDLKDYLPFYILFLW
ncbi:RNA polymerase sigma-70 factor [Massilibacteroides sp.]|uniref:RNA polymerase sigma-70 factor n=1 Tax=Massilibacteroides sp. TaxID=2034766 RepID=UPI0026082065|nr:RNA polymerase sigma-70 factor [Massilibacteroides sp.]MDD4516392.1 RNA polymerase sigma-70 factor [Massilibacteroides sp.]